MKALFFFLSNILIVNAKLKTVKLQNDIPFSLKNIVAISSNKVTFATSSTTHKITFVSSRYPVENFIGFQISIAEISLQDRSRCLNGEQSRPFELIFGNQSNAECIFRLFWIANTEESLKNSVTTFLANTDGTIEGRIVATTTTTVLSFRLTRGAPLSIEWPNVNTRKIHLAPGPMISGGVNDTNWLTVTKCFPESFFEDGIKLLNVRFDDLNYPKCNFKLTFNNAHIVLPDKSDIIWSNIECPNNSSFLIALFGVTGMLGALLVFLTIMHYCKTHPAAPPLKPLY